MLPLIPLAPDPAWVREIPFLRQLAGGIVSVGLVVAVAMLAVAAFKLVGAKQGWVQVDPGEPIKVMLGAMALVALSGMMAFSFHIVSFPGFSSGTSGVAPPWKPAPSDCQGFNVGGFCGVE
ncbi:hypothetical protein ACTVBU_10925 [Sanguibacter sp. A246]|uniref:hypothetical protein n=1 Tax=Sanguibacter sp. A246 TaxID=3457326 RepID=UPI003FD8DCCF